MENYSSFLSLIYYLAGIFSGFLMVLLLPKKTAKAPKNLRSWSKISNIDYTYNVDYEFKEKQTGQQVAYIMAGS